MCVCVCVRAQKGTSHCRSCDYTEIANTQRRDWEICNYRAMSLGEYELPLINVINTIVHFLNSASCTHFFLSSSHFRLFPYSRAVQHTSARIHSSIRSSHVCSTKEKEKKKKKDNDSQREMDCSADHVTIEFDRSEFMNK